MLSLFLLKNKGSSLKALILIGIYSCGKTNNETAIIKERVIEKKDYDNTSYHPPLSPRLIDQASKAFKQSYDAEVLAPSDKNTYTELKEICDQDESSLCYAFSIRDLLINNLNLNEEQKPSVYSLLRLNTFDSTKILLHPDLAFTFLHYDFIKVASQGALFNSERSEPFEAKLIKDFYAIKEGKGFHGNHISIPAQRPRLISISLEEEDYQSALIDISQKITFVPQPKVEIPKFKIQHSNVNTSNLVKEMSLLGKRLAVKKAQVMGVCGFYIRGFSNKLSPETALNARRKNTHIGASEDCGFHSVLVTDVRINDDGDYLIRFKNSWGTEYTDDGFHELEIEDFISILNLRLETEQDARMASYRLEFNRIAQNEIPTHKLRLGSNWQLYAQTKDSQNFLSDARLVNIFTKDEIICPLQEDEDKKCQGSLTWKSTSDSRKYYTYTGELLIEKLSPVDFHEIYSHGYGKVYLWGNLTKEGQFNKDLLQIGTFYQYFSAGRSSQLSIKETGFFDNNEELIKGTRTTYDRAGNILSKQTL